MISELEAVLFGVFLALKLKAVGGHPEKGAAGVERPKREPFYAIKSGANVNRHFCVCVCVYCVVSRLLAR